MEVPFLDLQTQNQQLKEQILPLWEEILESAHFIGGKHVEGFENEFAQACGVDHCLPGVV
jgi:dTDP-4-amino-4,6-dideoxygalactose transaminase